MISTPHVRVAELDGAAASGWRFCGATHSFQTASIAAKSAMLVIQDFGGQKA